jgi:hypothetical protein
MISRSLLRLLMATEFARSARLAIECEAIAFRAARAIRRAVSNPARLEAYVSRKAGRRRVG